MKKMAMLLFVGVLVTVPLGAAFALEVFRTPTGLIQYDQAQAEEGYILFKPSADRQPHPVFLIDMFGRVVHTWPALQNPRLYEDGLLVSEMKEMDWDGNILWQWVGPLPEQDVRVQIDQALAGNP